MRAGAPHLLVQGPAVARCYADPGIRSSVDLDLVVSPAALEQVLEALERYGSSCWMGTGRYSVRRTSTR
jgi:hypothetical protein